MNEMNPLEKQLESLIPRRPSAKLKARLFAQERGAQAAGLQGLAARQTHSFHKFLPRLWSRRNSVVESLRPAGEDSTRAACAPQTTASPAAHPHHVPVMAWLTPCACAFLLFLSLHAFRPDFGGRFPAAGGSNLMAGLSSNLLVLTAGENGSERQNLWSSITFEWTKAARSVSTMDSFPQWKTNVPKL